LQQWLRERASLLRYTYIACLVLSYGRKECYFYYVSELLTDDIAKAAECAKLIYRLQGFNPWHGWTRKCKNRPLPDVIHCLNETSMTDPPVYSVIIYWITEIYSRVHIR